MIRMFLEGEPCIRPYGLTIFLFIGNISHFIWLTCRKWSAIVDKISFYMTWFIQKVKFVFGESGMIFAKEKCDCLAKVTCCL